MAQLTLRTLLAYIDDTLNPALTRQLGAKVAESELALELIERIKRVTRRRGLRTPTTNGTDGEVSDPNTVAEYLSDTLDSEQVTRLEETCLESDVHLAEVAACHQILTIILTEPVRVPPRARERMYQLVKPPASIPNRRPGRAMPVGGITPLAAERPEHDDADTTLLLGMGRYSSGSFLGRVGLVAAVVTLAILLPIAVLMALPHKALEPPGTSPEGLYAAATVPQPQSEIPPPKPVPPTPEAGKKPSDATDPMVVAPPPKPSNKIEADLVKRPADPKPDRVPIGRVEGLNAIVLTQPDKGSGWHRLDPAGEATVTSHDQVLCLPGYRADVQLDSGVKAHLRGNVPELLPARLLETLVRFNVPPRKGEGKDEDFDADLTLHTGRVYLTSNKPKGSRIRIRFGEEVWDLTLPDDKTEVMAEVVSAFDPGSRDDAPPRVNAQVAVLRGNPARLVAFSSHPNRLKAFEKVPPRAVVGWDNKTGGPADPKPIEMGNEYYEKYQLIGSDQGKVIQKALTDMATRLTERTGIKVMLAELLTEQPQPGREWLHPMAIYTQAAITSGPSAGDGLKPLIDILTDESRGYARMATIIALSSWIAQAPGNSAVLEQQLAAKIRRDGEPERIVRLLKGYTSSSNPDPGDLDRLVEFLTDPSVAVRELAMWNLINFVDPSVAKIAAAHKVDAGTVDPRYDKFVKEVKAKVEELKAKPAKK